MKKVKPTINLGKTFRRFQENSFWDGLQFVHWKVRTSFEKNAMAFQDRFHLVNYAGWLSRAERNWKKQDQALQNKTSQASIKFSVILLNETPPTSLKANLLQRTLNSIQAQTYPNWEGLVCGTDGNRLCSPQVKTKDPGIMRLHALASEAESEKRKLFDELLSQTSGEWLLFVEEGDQLADRLLERACLEIGRCENADILYWDEDQIDGKDQGLHFNSPWLKPDWSPELFLSVNYLRKALIRRELLQSSLKEVAEINWDALLFAAVDSARQIAHLPEILLHANPTQQTQNISESHRARLASIRAHFEQMGKEKPEATLSDQGEIHLTWPASQKKASIIIPTKDNLAYLQGCIHSILSLTHDRPYEIILVDTGSQKDETHRYYESLKENPTIQIHLDDSPFNYSKANNFGASFAQGDILVFLNNDIEILDGSWLTELVQWASQAEIGIVGGKLLYPDGFIQHAGIILGMQGHASHVFSGRPEGSAGPFGSTEWYRDYLAVTGACMAMRHKVFTALGGFDEHYRLVFGDVELCLRVVEHGYRVMYNPYARLIHYEGKSRANFIPVEDIQAASKRFWQTIEKGDPYFNQNLSLAVRTPTLRRPWEEQPLQRLEKIIRWA